MLYKRKILICLSLLVFYLITHAQITSSPYTIFAAGQIQDNGFGALRAMGGTGIAFSSDKYLNNTNPASYAGIDSLRFMFEFGFFGAYTSFKTNQLYQSKIDGNIRYLALGLRVRKNWSASLGIVPVSSVGYSINTDETVEGSTTSLNKTYTGTGGINQFYFGNAVRLFKNLSAGIHVSYLFGNIEQQEIIEQNSYFSECVLSNKYFFNNLYFDYGLQYNFEHGKMRYSAGVIFGNKTSLTTSNEQLLAYASDTIIINGDETKFNIPLKFGIGIGIEQTEKFRLGIDYKTEKWSSARFKNPMLSTRDSERLSAGFEYTPKKGYKDQGLNLLYYRFGINFLTSYLVIDETRVNSSSFTCGIGIPMKRELSIINLAFEYGINGTLKNNLIRENYFAAHVNFTLQDRWFIKSRYD
ncbi:MAG: hypothetical protein JXB00_03485 [Bacteroidales bacterium]|nr:hypothetical protein [Bacteroidales bacterium]